MAGRSTPSGAGDATRALGAETRMLILHGSDRFLQDEKMQALAAALNKQHGADGVDTIRFDGQQGPRIIADVLDECRSCGLMQQHKVVVVDNAEMLLKETEGDEAPAKPAPRGGRRAPVPHTAREVLENYAAEPSSSATLVLRVGGGAAVRRRRGWAARQPRRQLLGLVPHAEQVEQVPGSGLCLPPPGPRDGGRQHDVLERGHAVEQVEELE
ncbi:MAG TPA: hypothetical protein PKE29_06795, partial [Phycisphaerales bacterium]|nr:hypothetical protein [Phycisphaerales bacterium]